MVIARTSNLLGRITTLLIICCLLTVGLCVNTAAALPGSGTQEDPWRIESLVDFDEFAADPNYWSGYTRLETDVDLAGRTYTTAVIAPDVNNSNYDFDGTAFTGVFDGNDHKIAGLTIDDGGAGNDYLGLFGYIDAGEISNLGLKGLSVSGSGDSVGGLVGENSGSISNCYSTGDVNGVARVGGLVGTNYSGSISNCYSTGNVSGGGDVGGLVGWNVGSLSNCYSTGEVIGTGWSVGGLVGGNGSWRHPPGIVSNCHSTGDVNGVDYVGGLVGENSGSISNCYSTGDVNGVGDVGGLVGQNGIPMRTAGIVSNCYSTGDVNGVDDVGGLVGDIYEGYIEWAFWDVETSGKLESAGGTGKTTAEMKTRSTFTDAGWDFVEIWLINEGATYPVLRQEIRSDLNGDRGVDILDFAVFADHWLEGTDF